MVLTENFDLSEFQSRDGAKMPIHVMNNIIKLAKVLQVMRNEFGRPITITSGYRSPEHNATVSGAVPNSTHTKGKAADFKVAGLTAKQMYDGIETMISQGKVPEGGLGLYSNRVHYDMRGYKSRWDATKKKDEPDIVDKTAGAIEGTIIMAVLTWIVNRL
ncbi:YcbK family protein [Flagellimonas onchidii]|uniref:YcbK family protein n=1 Tax=Flagellimonas onchidii TaxID=2562684 RepID=UPI0010A69099|nr:D-Ala-D-Ala carboxypeptidase family metallohydrolase [Allomuricauda onchidii]